MKNNVVYLANMHETAQKAVAKMAGACVALLYKRAMWSITASLIVIGSASCDRAPGTAPATSSARTTRSATTAVPSFENEVLQILSKQLGLKSGEIKLTHTFKDLAMDDLDVVEVTMALEDHFHIRIPDEAFVTPSEPKKYLNMTVRGLCDAVRNYQLHPSTHPGPATSR
jgi:acyl carrier protein